MNLSRERLVQVAEQTSFRPEVLEKVIRLLGLLDGVRSQKQPPPTVQIGTRGDKSAPTQ